MRSPSNGKIQALSTVKAFAKVASDQPALCTPTVVKFVRIRCWEKTGAGNIKNGTAKASAIPKLSILFKIALRGEPGRSSTESGQYIAEHYAIKRSFCNSSSSHEKT